MVKKNGDYFVWSVEILDLNPIKNLAEILALEMWEIKNPNPSND